MEHQCSGRPLHLPSPPPLFLLLLLLLLLLRLRLLLLGGRERAKRDRYRLGHGQGVNKGVKPWRLSLLLWRLLRPNARVHARVVAGQFK